MAGAMTDPSHGQLHARRPNRRRIRIAAASVFSSTFNKEGYTGDFSLDKGMPDETRCFRIAESA